MYTLDILLPIGKKESNMKKVLLSLVLAIALIVCGASFVACDPDEEPSGGSADFEYTLSDDQSYYILTDVTTLRNTAVVVPETYNGLPVKEIGQEAFGSSGLTSIEISSGVTSIGKRAFSSCSKLTSVTIPSSVTSVGDSAFGGCTRLTSVYYGGTTDKWAQIEFGSSDSTPLCYANNLYINNQLVTEANITSATKINDYAFQNCSSLTSVTIGNGVTSIGELAFKSCSSLTSVVIPDSVTSIGSSAFYNCSKLAEVTIGNGVTEIGESAFEECWELTSVYITDLAAWCDIAFKNSASNPLSVAKNSYSRSLYLNNEPVTELVIPDTATKINAYAFYKCNSLTSVSVGSGVTSIEANAFKGCYRLITVVIGDSVASIGVNAFNNCNMLTSITIPSSVTSIGDYAFYNCSSLSGKDHVYYKGTEEQWRSIKFGSNNGYLATPTYLGSK